MWPNPQFLADLVTFVEEIFNGKLHFCAVIGWVPSLSLLGFIFITICHWLVVLLHLGVEGVTEVETNPKGRFVFFKVTLTNDRVLCVCAPSGDSTRGQLAMGCFLEGLQNYMENKNKGNENKSMLGDFNCTMYKVARDGGNKAQTLYMPFQLCPVKTHSR